MPNEEFKQWIREVIEEEFSPKPVELAMRWQGGTMLLTPGSDGQSKEVPLEVFFRKLMSVRDSLRVLEQKISAQASLTQEEKLNFQGYITKAYGSLTTFNILFKEGKDKFHGTSGGGGGKVKEPVMTLKEARDKLGLNEY